MNKIFSGKAKLLEILRVDSPRSFHTFFFDCAMKLYGENLRLKKDFGSVLALGADYVEAEELTKYPFEKIVLSGILEPDDKIKEIVKKDKRVFYRKENMEKISFKNNSFDLVFVKEAIHHVPRPVLALYELLRVSKKAVIFIEPKETFLGNILEKLKLTSRYEKNQVRNIKFRDNFVYRWRENEIVKILNSYYLESGYKVYFKSCWMSNRYNIKWKSPIRIFNFFGWLFSFIPFNRGNYLICMIVSGKDKPKSKII
jgi:SAM-dependent methyltransferase